MKYKIVDSHIETIKCGDTVIHNDKMVTVCETDINRDAFIGNTIFGDSYRIGTLLVKKVVFIHKEAAQ